MPYTAGNETRLVSRLIAALVALIRTALAVLRGKP